MGLAVREITRKLDALASAQGVFLTLSAWGVVEATTLDGKPLSRSSLVAKISEAHWNLLKGETSQ
jgi:branched-subunit amino acid aminotransferase/4-amino-4-deoxychorismate lyase